NEILALERGAAAWDRNAQKRRRPRYEPGPPDGGGGAGYPPQPRSGLLDGFAVQREVEAFAFDLFADPQTDEEVHDLEQDQRNDGVIDEHGDDADALVDELLDVAIERAGGSAVLLDREDAGEQRADDAADRVHAERVERVIVAEHVLEAGAAPVTHDARRHANDQRADRTDETRRRRDGHKAGHSAGCDADHRRLSA